MGSDFRPHGCDPMGSAVGITPRGSLHGAPRCTLMVQGGLVGIDLVEKNAVLALVGRQHLEAAAARLVLQHVLPVRRHAGHEGLGLARFKNQFDEQHQVGHRGVPLIRCLAELCAGPQLRSSVPAYTLGTGI